jgi:hypothetical protein
MGKQLPSNLYDDIDRFGALEPNRGQRNDKGKHQEHRPSTLVHSL